MQITFVVLKIPKKIIRSGEHRNKSPIVTEKTIYLFLILIVSMAVRIRPDFPDLNRQDQAIRYLEDMSDCLIH